MKTVTDAIAESQGEDNGILTGLGQDYYCYMFGTNHHEYKCDMWPTVFDEVGGIGYLVCTL
ncbi:MAG: hypothetical protein H8D67_16330 [Deltaproteobacteria bacterium]|nr:hypothetical protein [Deltaproteobacteria bacterium]